MRILLPVCDENEMQRGPGTVLQHRVEECHHPCAQLDCHDEGDCNILDVQIFMVMVMVMVMIFNLGITPQDDHAKVDVERGWDTDKGARKELS